MYEEPTLFPDHDFPENNDPVDETEISQKIFYYSTKEWKELTKMAKPAMRFYWPDDPFNHGNLSDLFLKLLKRYHDERENNAPEEGDDN